MSSSAAPTRSILCFGDSNTWGSDPVTRSRFGPEIRWTGVLSATLGGGYEVIEEGLRGRTTVFDDPVLPGRNGSRYLLPCILSHQPLDVVVIMLGTNDMKNRFGVSAIEIALGVKQLVQIVRTVPLDGPIDRAPKLLVVSPPALGHRQRPDSIANYLHADEKSRALGAAIGDLAGMLRVPFFNAANVVETGDIDGIHLPPLEHTKLGKAIAREIELLFD